MPIIAALIGWVTNYIAVKMLFHPRKPIRVLFVTFHGVFPKRQQVVAEKFGEVVARELVSSDDILATVQRGLTSEAFVARLAPQLETMVAKDLPRELPMLAMFLTPELIKTVRDALLRMLEPFMQQAGAKLCESLKDEIDIQGMVREKVAAFSSDKLETMLLDIMRKEFKFIELVGAVLGFLIGIAQIALLYVVG